MAFIFALIKLFGVALLAIFGLLTLGGHELSMIPDEGGAAIVAVMMVYFSYVFKCTMILPWLYWRFVKPHMPEALGGPILVIFVVTNVWIFLFNTLFFLVLCLFIGYIWYLIDSIIAKSSYL